VGTFASRSIVVGGSAAALAAGKVQAKARLIAAHLLEASPDDVELADGRYSVRGSPDRGLAFAQIAQAAYAVKDLPFDMEPGLEEFASFDPENYATAFGTHISIVEADPETGEVELLRHIAVDDCGPQVNPLVVEGQVHGAVAQGVGQALWEGAVYDDDGQLLTGSFADYAMPMAHMLPSFETASTETPSPHNPLGVKGVGEAGTIAAPAAVVNAVVDALAPFGVRHVDMPLTAERVWRAVRGGG
jgi:carbon-monoxide dehydrogenase large subunit